LSLFLESTRQSRKGLCKARTRDLVLGCQPFALSWTPGPSGRRAAAGRGALAARRDMATQHDEWTPPVDGAPAVAGAPSRTLSSRGASPSYIVRSTAGWAWVGNTALTLARAARRVCSTARSACRACSPSRTRIPRAPARHERRAPCSGTASTVTSARDADGDNRTAVTKVYYHKRLNVYSPISKTRDPVNPLK